MCSHLFGKSTGGIFGAVGDIVGGVGGFALGGPVGAALGAEALGTAGGVIGGERPATAAVTALPAAALAGIGGAVATGGDLTSGLLTTGELPSVSGITGATATGDTSGVGAPVTPVTSTPIVMPASDMFGSPAPSPSGITVGATSFSDLGVSPDQAFMAGGAYDPSLSNDAMLPAQVVGGVADPNVPSGTTSPGFWGTMKGWGGDALSFLKANPGIGLAGAAMGYEALTQKPTSSLPGYLPQVQAADYFKGLTTELTNAGLPTLTNTMGNLSTQGQNLTTFLTSGGPLPPGMEAGLRQAAENQKAAIRSRYQTMGGDSSSMDADLAAVDNNMAVQRAQLAQSLYSTGVSEEQAAGSIAQNLVASGVNVGNLSAQIYSNLMKTALANDQSLQQAIATLAGAAARPSINVTQPGTATV